MANTVTYEQPLNERIRTFMRLEHLFQQLAHHMQGETVWDSRAVISQLIDVLSIFGRTDLKSEVLKELDRHATTLSRMKQSPEVDHERLGAILAEIATLSERLYGQTGQPAGQLRKSEFLKSIMQRSSIPGGTCGFDLPIYEWWLQRPLADRTRTLHQWLSAFDLIERAIRLTLRLTRSSGTTTQECAVAGFFQQTLDTNLPYQLVRVTVPRQYGAFAEISGGKHRFTVRFKTAGPEGRPSQVEQDIEFELTRCLI